ncbi:hypothetical protein M427DRAFT_335388 [Gonapodya prolifera JEL478]|uniref:Rieske domain-containing protein n=1 Tax=Gonapodya prolifera (strain JEL478) TaxID=1344416 RepID=A0A139AEJ8_GONPJ|nr:hypothetical protein M427DRAFT_335388 [Gonapodya prolifera JEL478]|eukprot:KXS14865.1 hypothetical protein M427DRAFT_335388 [Gonapodya prolifera JEL478]
MSERGHYTCGCGRQRWHRIPPTPRSDRWKDTSASHRSRIFPLENSPTPRSTSPSPQSLSRTTSKSPLPVSHRRLFLQRPKAVHKGLRVPEEGRQVLCVLYGVPACGVWLDQGLVMDIEDPMGKVANVVCPMHGWMFNSLTGTCYSSRSILDIYGIVVAPDPKNGSKQTVWCSLLPVNNVIEGPRRDFGGKVLKYVGDDMWAGDFTRCGLCDGQSVAK